MNRKQKKMLGRIIIAALGLIALNIVKLNPVIMAVLFLADYLIIGYDILRKAVKGIINRQVFDENFLMSVATVGAIALALYKSGDFNEAVLVMLFYQIGELFQSYAVGKSRRSIAELMDIRPDYANIEQGNELEQVDPDLVEAGSIIVVLPGERVPIDGVVEEGSSELNTSALTGESLPREVMTGDEVISGCINMTGVLKIRTTRRFGESTVSRILELVEDSASHKSHSEKFISRFAHVYTPAVCCAALALALLPPLVNIALGGAGEWGEWLYRALTFLIISCPCALVISVPLSFFAGIGGASREGILIKGSNYLETLAKTETVVFDKTGTLTKGEFEVVTIRDNVIPEEELLSLAAHAECASSHPISRSIRQACKENIDRSIVSDIREISGGGVIANVGGKTVAAGNGRLMAQLGLSYPERDSAGTTVHIAADGRYLGNIEIADVEKPSSRDAIRALKNCGVSMTVMLTGDTQAAAEHIASKLGIDEVHARLLPENKVECVEALLLAKKGKGALAFVGDGINDAPVLSRADVGIAMGAMGSDAAIEAADVVLMDDDPLKVAKAVRISRKCLSIVYQNIAFALGVKLVCLLLGALGIANMGAAIFADVGVMVIDVLNAMRAMYVKKT